MSANELNPAAGSGRGCRLELPGWRLLFYRLALTGSFRPAVLAAGLRQEENRLRNELAGNELSGHPVLAALRELFRQAGTSPSRYRPSSEALVRRVLKAESLPAIHPLVDFNNLLSLRTMCPCCVMRTGSVIPPLVFRIGRAGESITGLRGSLDLDGKPVLADTAGPFGTPITDDHRVVLTPADETAWLVIYAPAGLPGGLDRAAPDLAGNMPGLVCEELPVRFIDGLSEPA